MLTLRAIGSSKLHSYSFTDGKNSLSYKANNSYSIGVGAAYRFLGANITVKIPGALNQDTSRYGKTQKLDIQAFAFPRKITLDAYLQYYKGFYIAEKDILSNPLLNGMHGIRSDIQTVHLGLTGSYIFNAKRFSFRAAFLQNEYQKKSAGTPLLGGSIHYNWVNGDSALIPADIRYEQFFNDARFNRIGILSAGMHIGYAYTWVVAKHFFVTGVALAGAGGNYSFLRDNTSDFFEQKLGFQANLSYKAAIGYNSETFYAGLFYIGSLQRYSTPIAKTQLYNEPGMLRFVIAKRLEIHPPWEKKKKPEAVLEVQ